MIRRHRNRSHFHPYHQNGAGVHAPTISFVYQSEKVQIELKKRIQSGEERTLVLTSEEFFQISFESNEIQQVGISIANFGKIDSNKKSDESFRRFSMILLENPDRKNEHLYEWKVNDNLRVYVRNRRNDGRAPIDTSFVVEIRRVNQVNHPTLDGIMMAWHNFEGTFVHHRQERRNRIHEMEQQIRLTPKSSTRILSREKIDETEQSVDNCVICFDKFAKDEQVTRLTKCQHKFHQNCIATWLKGSDTCPLCRSKVNES